MKKSISFILVILMVTCLCACGNSEIQPLPTPTQAFYYEPVEIPVQLPTPVPTPAWQPATIRAGYAEVLWDTYNKGDELAVLGEWGDYYIICENETELLISNRIVRLNNELPFEPSTGYARTGTVVFETPFFDKKSSKNIEISTNTQVCVLDGKADWVYIEWENGSGYVQTDSISPYYIGSYSDEGGGAGSSSSSGSNTESSVGVDGGDIQLGYYVSQSPKLSLLSAYHGLIYSKYSDCTGTILCDKAEAYMCVLGYGDMVKVIDINEAKCTIYSEEMSATLPRWLVQLETDASYNQWEAFAQHGAKVYREYQLKNVDYTLNRNNKVKIVDELAELNLYVVEANNSIGYMEIDSVSETEIHVYENYYDSSTGSTPESNTVVQEWTAPVL